MGMSPANRRITAMILAWVALSLATSVLPLVSGVAEVLPFDFLARENALVLHACALLGFMGLAFPLFVADPDREGSLVAWWWVGGFVVAFAGVPLYVLAYIAGVHRDGVVAILGWCGVVHGAALLLLGLTGGRARGMVPALAAIVLAALPFADWYAAMLVGRGARFGWSPSARVLEIARDHGPARLGQVLALLLPIYLAVLVLGRLRGRSAAAAAGAALLLAGGLVLASPGAAAEARQAPVAASGLEVLAPSGRWMVAGRCFPLGISAPPELGALRLEVGGRLTWVAPRRGEGRVWLYPRPVEAGESLVLRGADGVALAELRPEFLPDDSVLALLVGPLAAEGTRAVRAAEPRLQAETLDADDLPDRPEGFEPFSIVVGEAGLLERVGPSRRRALEDWVAEGGRLLLLGAATEGTERRGDGVVERVAGREAASLGALRQLRSPALEASIYESFEIPDWSRVELGGILLFLGLYHLVFLLVFLLPLVYDARKSMAIYLVSVGFVLALVILGAWQVLTRTLLAETQVLQQELTTLVLREPAGPDARPALLVRQDLGFASFNEAPARLVFRDQPRLRPVLASARQQVGEIRVEERRTVFEEVRLDRFRKMQVVELLAVQQPPFAAELEGDRLRLVPRAGVADPLGLLTARRAGAFARLEGRLHRVAIRGDGLEIAAEPEARSWAGVLPAELLASPGSPALRRALARGVRSDEDVVVLLLEGLRPLHSDPSYLLRREVATLLVVPLNRP